MIPQRLAGLLDQSPFNKHSRKDFYEQIRGSLIDE